MTFDWLRAQKDQPFPSVTEGASGYFSKPEATLDPHLFMGNVLMSNVRNMIMGRLIGFLARDMKFNKPELWVKAWLTGSGITYQWSADRGNGDLDVLLGVDRDLFDRYNTKYAGIGDSDLALFLDKALKQQLWPTMVDTSFNGKRYEVTYFYNAGTHDDIRNIHPYAAYDLLTDEWIITPPQDTADTHQFPDEFAENADQDHISAQSLVGRYSTAYANLRGSAATSSSYLNAASQLNVITTEARALLDDIHQGRRKAFQGNTGGYLAWPNYRWQAAKQSGAIKALSEIAGVRQRAQEDTDTELYGGPLNRDADDLRIRAMLYRQAP